MCDCGAESFPARLPSGRHIELVAEETWVAEGERWPDGRLFSRIAKPAPGHPEPFYAQPVIWLTTERPSGQPSGPFYREHVCA